jgi:hypothetical protein
MPPMFVTLLLAMSLSAAKPAPKVPSKPVAAPALCPEPPVAVDAPRATTVRMMLPDLDVSPRFANAAAVLGQVVAAEAGKLRGYTLLTSSDVRAVLDQEASKQLVGCDDTGCLAELAEALDAELVVSGKVGETPDGTPLVSLTLINARALVVVNRVTAQWSGPLDRLADVVKTSTQRLLVEAHERAPGGIRLTGAPARARVFVDGEARVVGNDAHLGGLDVGVHEVTVEADDKLPRAIPVVVLSGTDSVVDATLDDVPVAAAWLWAGGIGAVVVGAAATGAVAWFSGQGTANVVVSTPDTTIANADALRSLAK